MAYNAAHLSVLAYANGFTLWHYKTADTAATALAPADGAYATAGAVYAAQVMPEPKRSGIRVM